MTYTKKSHFWPIIFILSLFSICIFIIGIQYGRSVANTDAAINYIKSLQPSKGAIPTVQSNIGYIQYVNDICGIQMIYPLSMKMVEDVSGVSFSEGDRLIKIFCSSQLDKTINLDVKTSSVEVDLKEASYSAQVGTFIKYNTDDYLLFTIIHPNTKKSITIISSKEYKELITSSIRFITPKQ